MANLITLTLYKSDVRTYIAPVTRSFNAENVIIRRDSLTAFPAVNMSLLDLSDGIRYYASNFIENVIAAASPAMVQVTVYRIDNQPFSGVAYGFPSQNIDVRNYTGIPNVTSVIMCNRQAFYCLETQSAITSQANTAANAGGTGTVASDEFTGTTNTSYTLTHSGAVLFFLNGVVQKKSTYSISGTTATINFTPELTDYLTFV